MTPEELREKVQVELVAASDLPMYCSPKMADAVIKVVLELVTSRLGERWREEREAYLTAHDFYLAGRADGVDRALGDVEDLHPDSGEQP